jgi:hypothetical protein
MFLMDKFIAEADDLELELLKPTNLELLDDYYFAMEMVSDNGNWFGYIVLPDDREVAVAYNAASGSTKYRKDDAYYQFSDDAKKIFPLDSCAIDTMSALLVLSEANGWDQA